MVNWLLETSIGKQATTRRESEPRPVFVASRLNHNTRSQFYVLQIVFIIYLNEKQNLSDSLLQSQLKYKIITFLSSNNTFHIVNCRRLLNMESSNWLEHRGRWWYSDTVTLTRLLSRVVHSTNPWNVYSCKSLPRSRFPSVSWTQNETADQVMWRSPVQEWVNFKLDTCKSPHMLMPLRLCLDSETTLAFF